MLTCEWRWDAYSSAMLIVRWAEDEMDKYTAICLDARFGQGLPGEILYDIREG